jgi:ABC-2 type transport system permease protein
MDGDAHTVREASREALAMNHAFKNVKREWLFMTRQRYVLVLLVCAFAISAFSVATGLSEVEQQRQTIERLKTADQIDRAEAQEKYNDPGSLAYYSFHLTYSEPSNLAFAALGARDIYPWKHRVRMLALEGQIYESDSQNPELAQAGKMDFLFVLSALSPLFIILLFHDLFASERANGRHDFLVSTASSLTGLWGSRALVRFLSIFACLMLPFYIGAIVSSSSFAGVFWVSVFSLAYLISWTLLSVWLGKKANSAPSVASVLIGFWVLFAFVIPILGDLAISKGVHSPKGGDILLVQRESVNDAWDLPVQTTIDAFSAVHPQYKHYQHNAEGFDWGWYYAFQQVGDQQAAPLSEEYRIAASKKYTLAGYVAFISPPMLLQRKLTRIANTDAIAAFEYEQRIRDFHKELRLFYYPSLLGQQPFEKSTLDSMPSFTPEKAPSS